MKIVIGVVLGLLVIIAVAIGAGALWYTRSVGPAPVVAASSGAVAPEETNAVTEQLPLIDLCGSQPTTEAFLADLQQQRGVDGVVAWFGQNIKLPANLRICKLGGAESVMNNVAWLLLQRVSAQGAPLGPLGEWGNKPRLGQGYQTYSLNVLPGGPGFGEGFGIVLSFKP